MTRTTASHIAAWLSLVTAFSSVDGFQLQPQWTSITRSRRAERNLVVRNIGPEAIGAGAVVVVGGAAALNWFSGFEGRANAAKYDAQRAEREQLAYIEPRDVWTKAELAKFDGTDDPTERGPLLFAADGNVYNVWKGRHFYGPGCEYHIFAGRDATRLLAKTKLEEETPEEEKAPLNIAERAALAGWIYTFRGKYDVVGKLQGYDPTDTTME